MSQLTEQMNSAIANLKAGQTGISADQVQAIVAPLKASIDAITTSEKSDEDKLADVTAAVIEFTTAFASVPATPQVPVPVAAPTAPSPDSTSAPAPEAPTPAAAS